MPEVVQANEWLWITEDSDRIDIRWPGRYINRRHHDQGWLNAVKEHADVSAELDDHEGISSRNIKEFHNIEGLGKIKHSCCNLFVRKRNALTKTTNKLPLIAVVHFFQEK